MINNENNNFRYIVNFNDVSPSYEQEALILINNRCG